MADQLNPAQQKMARAGIALVSGLLAVIYLSTQGIGSGLYGLFWLWIYGMIATAIGATAMEFGTWLLQSFGVFPEPPPPTPEQIEEFRRQQEEHERRREARRQREHQFNMFVIAIVALVVCFLALMGTSSSHRDAPASEIHYEFNYK